MTCMEERMGEETGENQANIKVGKILKAFYLKGRLYVYQKSAVLTGPSLKDVFCL